MIEENELPQGWVWTQVGAVYDIVGGGTPTTSVEEYWEGDIAWITSADIHGLKDIRPRKRITRAAIENSASNLVPEGSLIVVTRVGLGKVALVKEPLCFSQDSQALIDNSSSIYPDYSLYYLAQATQLFKYQNRGTTIGGVTKKQLSELSFPLPPLSEQQRIVEAIEQQLSRLDVAVSSLRQAQKTLKRYRASVLKAAVEGELTADWRAAHPDTEPASKLLTRILAERRAKWEEEQITKGRNSQKVKYVEPVGPDVSKLGKLPEGWCWATVGQVALLVTDGDHNPPARVATGIPHLTAKNIFNSRINFNECSFITIENAEKVFKRYKPLAGDLIITCVGTVGRTAIVPDELNFSPDRNLAAVRTVLGYRFAKFLEYCFLSPDIQEKIANASGSTAQPHLYLADLRSLDIPLPPLAEQEQIVSLVEEKLSIISELETTIKNALERAARQRQSILHMAFTGKLVPQDPNEEPASVLLERIRREREEAAQQAAARTSKPPKVARKTKKSDATRAVKAPEGPVEPIEAATQGDLWQEVMTSEVAKEVEEAESETVQSDLWHNVNA